MQFAKQWNIAAVAAASAVLLGLAASAAPAGAASTGQSGGVSPDAALGTPQLDSSPKNEEVVKQIAQCGGTTYAVGSFTTISQGSTVFTRNNILSFKATAPYTVTSWAPDVNGQVNTIAFNGSHCADAYIGGEFTSVNGTAVSDIAEISTSTGDVVSSFGHSANQQVWTIQAVKGHLLVGGDFTFINGSKNPFLASLSPASGKNDGFVHLKISEDYQYCAKGGKPCTKAHHPEIYNQQLSHGGTLDLLEGHFTSVGGLPRQQIFMLNVGGTKATVTAWTSAEWDGSNTTAYPDYQCWPSEAFYIRSAAWSPDDSTVYIADTGFHPALNGTNPRKGLCDAVAAFPATQSSVTQKWINYSGCDSFYSVSADNSAVYAAGHPRWANNNNGCNKEGPGATPDAGLWGLTPSTGAVELNSSGTALYTMTRDNASHMLITKAGLWIASDNRNKVNKCGSLKGQAGHNAADHAGICFLKY
jgi:polyisoprenoid-binding protein YceI